jgi:hypothetical protein
MFGIKTSLSILFELLGFVFVLFYFHSYVAERKGVEYNPIILNGAKLYRDDKGVKIKLNFLKFFNQKILEKFINLFIYLDSSY